MRKVQGAKTEAQRSELNYPNQAKYRKGISNLRIITHRPILYA
ncbi:hypothetical protein [Porphyromonas macacae]|nr:hypothetical protein [Porphyromonas macacae]